MARARRVKQEREAVAWALVAAKRPSLPCRVLITRVAPSTGLDDDNLSGSCKAARDQIAAWLGVDDKHADIVGYDYAQRRGPWGVEIEFKDWPVVADPSTLRDRIRLSLEHAHGSEVASC